MKEVHDFILLASQRDLQLFIHNLAAKSISPKDFTQWFGLARTAVDICISRDQSESAKKMENQTNKIIRLTWGLFWLTLILTFVAAVQLYIMLTSN